MSKKILFALALSLFSAGLFADVGLGFSGGVDAGTEFDIPLGITAAYDGSPWVFLAEYKPKNRGGGLYADNWMFYENVTNSLNYYVLWGVSASFSTKEEVKISAGSRAGFGLNFFFPKSRALELFAQAVWNPEIGVKHDNDDRISGNWKFFQKIANFPCEGGVRLWIR